MFRTSCDLLFRNQFRLPLEVRIEDVLRSSAQRTTVSICTSADIWQCNQFRTAEQQLKCGLSCECDRRQTNLVVSHHLEVVETNLVQVMKVMESVLLVLILVVSE